MGWSEAEYYTVREPFEVFVHVAHYPSNTYGGSSQMYGSCYVRATLAPGDRVALLPGGSFVVRGERCDPAKIELSDKHPFEKVYLRREPEWPLDRLERADRFDVTVTATADVRVLEAEWVYANGEAFGRNIDYILKETPA